MRCRLAAVLLAVVCCSPVGHAQEWTAPTVVAPTVAHSEPPAAALPAHAKRIGAVAFDMDALRPTTDAQPTRKMPDNESAWLTPRLHLQLFADVGLEANGLRIEQDAFGNTTWVGNIDGVEDGIVLLTTNGNRVVGRVDYGLDQYLLTGDTRTGVWVTGLDPASYVGMSDAGFEDLTSSALGGRSNFGIPDASQQGVTAGHTIDVLVLYSSKALQQMDSGPFPRNPAPFVANLVADVNQSFNNSSVNGAVRVVGYELITGYTEPIVSNWNDSKIEFIKVRNSMWGPFHTPNPYLSTFSGVPALRDQYHADVVVMFIDGTRVTQGPCGISILMESAGGNPSNVYQVLSTACAIGDRTFTHELGHILAGRHDITDSLKKQDCVDPFDLPGCVDTNPFTTDVGYTNFAAPFRTIMGSLRDGDSGFYCDPSNGCPRLNRWSDPSQFYMGYPLGQSSFPIGTTSYSNDMVYTLNVHDTVGIVAAYRTPTGLALPGSPGTPQHYDCQSMTHIEWSAASGTVGWYESEFDSSSSFSSPFGGYEGPGTRFSTHLFSSQWFRVRACNAAGCGGWGTTHIPATGPNCEIPPV